MPKKEGRIVSFELDPANRSAPSKRKRKSAALARRSDDQIDYSDLPKLSAAFLGRMYRPVKRQMTVRIDADVLAWLRSQGTGYHSRLNQVLRSAMLADLSGAAASHPKGRARTS
jgi:uncharacterized protein (DUF4415 family)